MNTPESPLPLTAAQRVALAPLTWTLLPVHGPGERIGRFILRGEGEEGTFTLMPAQGLTQDETVEIRFEPPFDPQALPVSIQTELGFVARLDLALGTVALMRQLTLDPDLTIDERLKQAGFALAHPLDGGTVVYHKPWSKRGLFSLFVSPDRIWLTFEKSRATQWHNLARINLVSQVPDYPLMWPPSFPERATAALAWVLCVAQAWDPRQVYRR